jgi:MFS family permease
MPRRPRPDWNCWRCRPVSGSWPCLRGAGLTRSARGGPPSSACLAYLALVRPSGIPFLVALALIGAGVGASTAPNNAATVGAVPREHQGVASGVLNMIRSFGTAMGLSITASVFTAVAGSAVDPSLVAGGFSAAAWMLAGVAFVGGVLAVLRGNVKLSADPTLRVE